MSFEREKALSVKDIENRFTNKADFVINNQIVIDFKARPIVTKEDYYQMNGYLEAMGCKLGMIVNFRNKYLKPIRGIRSRS